MVSKLSMGREAKHDLRQSLLAESDMTLALISSFSSYFSLSFPLIRSLFG